MNWVNFYVCTYIHINKQATFASYVHMYVCKSLRCLVKIHTYINLQNGRNQVTQYLCKYEEAEPMQLTVMH